MYNVHSTYGNETQDFLQLRPMDLKLNATTNNQLNATSMNCKAKRYDIIIF